MSKRKFITFRSEYLTKGVYLEVPGDCSINDIISDLVKTFNWPLSEKGKEISYVLKNKVGDVLNGKKNLTELQIDNSSELWIEVKGNKEITISGDSAILSEVMPVVDLSPPREQLVKEDNETSEYQIDEPCLSSDKGILFILDPTPVSIGRKAKNYTPDFDLSELETDKVASKHHADIEKKGDDFILIPQKTTNGTFVNGKEIQPKERFQLTNGDVIQFGYRTGVKLEFNLPKK